MADYPTGYADSSSDFPDGQRFVVPTAHVGFWRALYVKVDRYQEQL
jgi:hypothetical protein